MGEAGGEDGDVGAGARAAGVGWAAETAGAAGTAGGLTAELTEVGELTDTDNPMLVPDDGVEEGGVDCEVDVATIAGYLAGGGEPAIPPLATIVPRERAATPDSVPTETVGPAAQALACAAILGRKVRIGTSASHAASPKDQWTLPRETFSRARTTAGSNWEPLFRASSLRASVAFIAFL